MPYSKVNSLLANKKLRTVLMSGGAIVALLTSPLNSQEQVDCGLDYQILPEQCEDINHKLVVIVPPEPNQEWDRGGGFDEQGFVLSFDGEAINADRRIEDAIRDTDLALEKVDFRITFDGLGVKPRLDLNIDQSNPQRMVFQSRLNYPVFVQRGEVRIYETSSGNVTRLVQKVPIESNGEAEVSLDTATNPLVAVYRVYDDKGRFDETHPIPIGHAQNSFDQGFDEGDDNTATRKIPIRGGAITVASSNITPNSVVSTLGTTTRADSNGNFVVQRIMPIGYHDVAVAVAGQPQNSFLRRVEIPQSEFFYVATADVTIGKRLRAADGVDDTISEGRFAGYIEGKTASGYSYIVSGDTEEQPLNDIFRQLNRKDAYSVLNRIDLQGDGYQVFGDESQIEDRTPTSGNIYAKLQKDNNFLLWGDFRGRLTGNHFIRNERTLYGFQGKYESQRQTATGTASASLQVHAAQPESTPGREVFRGTSGSLYFLSNQDLTIASETVTIEIRDKVTNRIVDRVQLQNGRDYSINYLQGTVILAKPLSSKASSAGLIDTQLGGDNVMNLVVQYEYTPTDVDIDGLNMGVRGEAWVTGDVRVGTSYSRETTGSADTQTLGFDLVYNFGKNSFTRIDHAKSDGVGFGSAASNDGGLIVNTTQPVLGEGEATRAELHIDLSDIGLNAEGYVSAYAEKRTLGFSSLDYNVTEVTGDETLWGVALSSRLNKHLSYDLSHNDYKNTAGDSHKETNAAIDWTLSEAFGVSLGFEHLDKKTLSETGTRTDVAARLKYSPIERISTYIFAQSTVRNSGLQSNDRFGFGGTIGLNENWSLQGEVSNGDLGDSRRLFANYENPQTGNALYFGYDLDPSRLVSGSHNSEGQYVVGGRRSVSDKVDIYAENGLDTFENGVSLTQAYGAEYRVNENLSFGAAIETGKIEDRIDGDFERNGVSASASYENEKLDVSGRLEYRIEEGTQSTSPRDLSSLFAQVDARYQISEASRLQFSLDLAKSKSDTNSFLEGDLLDYSVGYAYRPVTNDRLNFFFQYRYLDDSIGQVIDGNSERAVQNSHILSADFDYSLNPHWSLGGKLGVRKADVGDGETANLVENNATLGILNARYHVVHAWDFLAEYRVLDSDLGGRESGFLAGVYRHFGNNVRAGVSYNFSNFSDDLTDLSLDDRGIIFNVVAKF